MLILIHNSCSGISTYFIVPKERNYGNQLVYVEIYYLDKQVVKL